MHRVIGFAFVLLTLLVAACQTDVTKTSRVAPAPSEAPIATAAEEVPAGTRTITLGDIDPDEPAKKIKRFKPLAD